jgi:hypothetical protein
MRFDGGVVGRLATLAVLGVGLFVAGWRIPSDDDYTESARIHDDVTIGDGIHIVPSDVEPVYGRGYAEALASQSLPGAGRLPVAHTWLGYYGGFPEDARGLVYVVSLDPGPERYTCESGPLTTDNVPGDVACPNYRTVEMTSVISATTGERLFSQETAEPYRAP